MRGEGRKGGGARGSITYSIAWQILPEPNCRDARRAEEAMIKCRVGSLLDNGHHPKIPNLSGQAFKSYRQKWHLNLQEASREKALACSQINAIPKKFAFRRSSTEWRGIPGVRNLLLNDRLRN